MKHLELLRNGNFEKVNNNGKDLLDRATGRFYTHELAGMHMIAAILSAARIGGAGHVDIVEPFCGDGRLIEWLLNAMAKSSKLSKLKYAIEIWDCDSAALDSAKERIEGTGIRLGLDIKVNAVCGDTFALAPQHYGRFQICLTNPPWDVLKPDRRELAMLKEKEAGEYILKLKEQDQALAMTYPLALPARRFSGWGTNLARCGVEVALRLTAPKGVCGFVSPASLLADQMSDRLRRWIFKNHKVTDIAYYVAEARLFNKVDQPAITLVASPCKRTDGPPAITYYNRERKAKKVPISKDDLEYMAGEGFVIPLQFGIEFISVLRKIRHLPKFSELEKAGKHKLWAGRELDETGHQKFLVDKGKYMFAKGRMIKRFGIAEKPEKYVNADTPVPKSADCHRIAWRDVSRPSQKRRVHATIIPPGWVTGNSLSVAYLCDNNLPRLKALLAVMNSLVFEAQVRGYLATAHVSLGAVREVRVPKFSERKTVAKLSSLADLCMEGDTAALSKLEVEVAKLYALSPEDFGLMLKSFNLDDEEKQKLLESQAWNAGNGKKGQPAAKPKIPNHYSAQLSKLDLMIAKSVPPGGNWKNIPKTVPSDRLKQIRVSYAEGYGSRSTYYGRLKPDAPAYTINTYFSRPGNGCHIHYDQAGGQDRVLSQREAARLQSFPDSFIFYGSNARINQQIGNAVPPLLAYQIAKSLSFKGRFIDLFCGAGGLSLGFLWAGWKPVAANDIEQTFLDTYRANIHKAIIRGDIRDEPVFNAIVEACRNSKARKPLFVLGGPPCQGFSTAGNRRSMEDDRNWLFRQYVAMLRAIGAAGFVFENVTGLLNMEDGCVFEMIRTELGAYAKALYTWKLHAEEYGIPQRRTRLFIIGDSARRKPLHPPDPVTLFGKQGKLFGKLAPAVTVGDALSDLPALKPGENGAGKDYVCEPKHPYQSFMRGTLTAEEYLQELLKGA